MQDPFQPFIVSLSPALQFTMGLAVLLAATQLVVIVLNRLESRRFSSVFLGTLVTPLCTGFPNLVIGIFGRSRLQGDLVIQLNIGNNLANTSLVVGLLLLVGGSLEVRPKTKSKAAKRAVRLFFIALAFMWLALAVLTWTAHDGLVDRVDAAALIGLYAAYHLLNFGQRRQPTKKNRLQPVVILSIITALCVAALAIHLSLSWIGSGIDGMGQTRFGPNLGLLLGLLTVFPESFLMLRLAIQKGNVGFSGLIGDCLVSIPLVIGLSAMIDPVSTTPFASPSDIAMWPYVHLAVTTFAFSWLCLQPTASNRKTGLVLIGLYVMVWLNSGA